jgi:hypothetical protein
VDLNPDKIDDGARLRYPLAMDKQSRRQLVRDYKERKVPAGIFAVRCAASGEIWLGASRNLATQQNSIWFGARTGGYANRALQAAWTAHGEGAFAFEVLETLDDEDLTPLGRSDLLKRRLAHWLETTGGAKIVG